MGLYKRDARSERTKEKLKNALIALSETKSVKKITVAELCKCSGINRGTFYNHYDDVDDLVYQIECDIFEQVKSSLNDIKVFTFDENFFREVIDIIKNNLGMIQAITKDNVLHNNLFRKVYLYAKDKFINEFTEYAGGISAEEAEDFFIYTFGGSVALLIAGVKSFDELDKAARKADFYNGLIVRKSVKERVTKPHSPSEEN